LPDHEQTEARGLIDFMNNSSQGRADAQTFRRFGELMSKADLFDPIDIQDGGSDFQPEIYWSVWPEAERLRNGGTLIGFGKEIRCPVVAIHGDYDPHLAEGVREPLQRALKDFKFILLKDCGHYPWVEKRASQKFFEILNGELEAGN
jgi:pimeloyl-ACP methyl ester carboxylesterase